MNNCSSVARSASRRKTRPRRWAAPSIGGRFRSDRSAHAAAALAETIGDQARYTIDHKISLARQRSALLPLVNQEITGQRVSIFNEKVNSKFPLRGLKIKNTTEQSLMQGPVSVYEGGSYAGDARLPDLQANEERLFSFAVDQAVEVKSRDEERSRKSMTTIRIVKGVVEETHRLRKTTKYLIKNRSGPGTHLDRGAPIETDWKLVGAEKPAERSRDFYRFEWKMPAGKALVREVIQERIRQQKYSLLALNSSGIELLAHNSGASPKLREALQQADRTAEPAGRHATGTDPNAIAIPGCHAGAERACARASTRCRPTPRCTKRYLEKLDKQETQIETLQTQIAEKQEMEKKQQKELEQYLVGLSVE